MSIKTILFLCTASLLLLNSHGKLLGNILPTVTKFIATLLNIAEDAVEEAARTFTFNGTVDPTDIHIVYFSENSNSTSNYSLGDSNDYIDINEPIVVIIHGWNSGASSDWIPEMASAYHQRGINNTLAIDWSSIAEHNYLLAAASVKSVGRFVADWLLDNILQNDTSLLENVHLVGHSLGAHVSGSVGSHIYNSTGQMMGRISGLDPAGPLFAFPIELPESDRLDASDAMFVDIYHTCGGLLGILTPIGDQDFFINNGTAVQPGCDNNNIIEAIKCSHGYSHHLFIKTINSDGYLARKCGNATKFALGTCNDNIELIMGENVNRTDIVGTCYSETDSDLNPM